MLKICPKYTKCPIFKAAAGIDEETSKMFKTLFCDAGEDKFKTCKRYRVAEKTGVSPPVDIMPNSFYSCEEIIEIMTEQGLIQNKKGA